MQGKSHAARWLFRLGPALLALLLLVPAAWAQSGSKPLSLEAALELGLNYSPNLAAAREDLAAAEAARGEAGTRFLPTLSTAYQYKGLQNPSILKTAIGNIPLAAQHTYLWSTTVTQPIFTGFNLLSAYRLAELGVDVASAQIVGARLDVALAVKEAFLEYLRAQRGLEVAGAAVASLRSHHQNTRDFHEVGLAPMNDVLKAELELANSLQQEVAADNAVALARSRLNRLLGRSLAQDLAVEDILKGGHVALGYEQARGIAHLERPELAAIDLQLRQGQQSVRQAQAGFYPQVSVSGSYIFTSDRPELGDSQSGDATSWQVMGQVDWTLWDWGRTRQQVSQRRANLRKLEATRRDLIDGVDLQVMQSLLTLSETEKNIATAQASIASAEENFRITQERFKEQLATNTEVLDAQTQLTQARNNYYNALTAFNLAEARLQRALGRGLPAPTAMAQVPSPPASGGPATASGPAAQ